ncbi:MAG: nucleotidyltransferase domain-containing protein, partial [Calditrichaeota bacterium]
MKGRRSPFRYKIIRQIRDAIAAYAPERVYLFGSYARNEADDVSDVDIVVIKETEEEFFDRMKQVVKLLNLPRAIDVLVYTPEEFQEMLRRGNAFAEMVVEEGVIIYEQEAAGR